MGVFIVTDLLHVKGRIGPLAEAMIMDGVKDFYELAAQ